MKLSILNQLFLTKDTHNLHTLYFQDIRHFANHFHKHTKHFLGTPPCPCQDAFWKMWKNDFLAKQHLLNFEKAFKCLCTLSTPVKTLENKNEQLQNLCQANCIVMQHRGIWYVAQILDNPFYQCTILPGSSSSC